MDTWDAIIHIRDDGDDSDEIIGLAQTASMFADCTHPGRLMQVFSFVKVYG